MRSSRRVTIAALSLLLVAAACTKSSTKAISSATPVESPMMSGGEGMMSLPRYAESYHTSFTSPADGVKITGNDLPVSIKVTGYTLRCDLAAKKDQSGTGHIHILLDKELVNMFCTNDATISMQNVKPGMHKLEVLPALNQHDEVEKNGQEITFDYEPSSPLRVITDESKGTPSIKILSPKAGETVTGDFDVKVQISAFESDCNLFGKPDVAGYGHWHLNLDSNSGAMMGMAGLHGFGGMMGMSCADTFRASTAGLASGSDHTLIALLVGNSHAPLSPPVQDQVRVKVG